MQMHIIPPPHRAHIHRSDHEARRERTVLVGVDSVDSAALPAQL